MDPAFLSSGHLAVEVQLSQLFDNRHGLGAVLEHLGDHVLHVLYAVLDLGMVLARQADVVQRVMAAAAIGATALVKALGGPAAVRSTLTIG